MNRTHKAFKVFTALVFFSAFLFPLNMAVYHWTSSLDEPMASAVRLVRLVLTILGVYHFTLFVYDHVHARRTPPPGGSQHR